MSSPDVSVIIPTLNEWPIVAATCVSVVNELWSCGYSCEVIVVDNGSEGDEWDYLNWHFHDWIRRGILRPYRWTNIRGTYAPRQFAAEKAKGEVLLFSDAHMLYFGRTMGYAVEDVQRYGGLWHVAISTWGDPKGRFMFCYKNNLRERFWGSLQITPPKQAIAEDGSLRPCKILMGPHACYLARRNEWLAVGGYGYLYRGYGGGESAVDVKYWLSGREVWLEPRATCSHCRGWWGQWVKVHRDKDLGKITWVRNRGFATQVRVGEEYLRLVRRYTWTSDDFMRNCMLSAYICGGQKWFESIRDNFLKKMATRYHANFDRIASRIPEEAAEDRKKVESFATMTLDELLESEPWESKLSVARG